MENSVRYTFALILCIGLASEIVFGARKELKTVNRNDIVISTVEAQAPSSDVESACASRVEIFGYPCEEHTVTTQDGYILSLQRIPNGRSGSTSGGNKIPVLLQHGLFMDGITWLLNSPDESLGYILADTRYDVWIANTRGTTFSQGHTSLSPNDPAYWDWTWDELAAYDLPANFEYVYQQTGNQKMHYVGHSLGTLIGFASFSEDALLSMLRSTAMLSPIAYMDQISSPLARSCAKMHLAEEIYKMGWVEFDPKSNDALKLLKPLCNQPGVDCYHLMSSFMGPNCCLNESAIDVFLDHEPQPTATKNLVHIAQMVRTGTITKYDYNNDDENRSRYGKTPPPAYNISNIPDELPLFLCYGGADELSDVKDVLHLVSTLHSHDSDKLKVLYEADYAHADFVMGVNAKEVVYDPLMDFFKLW